jgi:hypothetical protein
MTDTETGLLKFQQKFIKGQIAKALVPINDRYPKGYFCY